MGPQVLETLSWPQVYDCGEPHVQKRSLQGRAAFCKTAWRDSQVRTHEENQGQPCSERCDPCKRCKDTRPIALIGGRGQRCVKADRPLLTSVETNAHQRASY